MAIAYAKLYELIYKNVKDKEKAEELYKLVEEFIKENEQRIDKRFEENKVIIKTELKDELKSELATKEDIHILEEKMNTMEERLKGEMKAMEEKILRYVDNKFNQLDKKFTIFFIVILITIIITNPNAIELIKLLFGFK
ncbi:hypothetical protein [Methanotorris formicicus]|uniref:DUF1640 domain-containing protein n=1 Tax=Methanotorris formicicus Mc-S-70 TaxID=647171 RepID=H1L121_9EURY|nr:hypothetical protein [Methanotorris formicicus]EHP84186.1 hypothetical protein MetfoDRAFT_1745 [Methanotorris formicicus Mc-S-70]